MGLMKKTTRSDEIVEAQPDDREEPMQFASFTEESLNDVYRVLDTESRRKMLKELASIPESLPFLIGKAKCETNPRLRQSLFDTLILIARHENLEQETVEAVLELLCDGDAEVRSHAVGFLSVFPRATGKVMPALLGDDNPDTRLYALDVLQHLVHPDVPVWLTGVLQSEQHPNVMASAIDRCIEAGCIDLSAMADDIAARFQGSPFIGFALSLATKRLEGIH